MKTRLLALPLLSLAAAALAQADPMRPLAPAAGAASPTTAAAASAASAAAQGSSDTAAPWLLAIRQDPLGQRSALINQPATTPGAAAAPRWLREGQLVLTADGEARIVAIRPVSIELLLGKLRLTQHLLAPLLPSAEARPADSFSASNSSPSGAVKSRPPASTIARLP